MWCKRGVSIATTLCREDDELSPKTWGSCFPQRKKSRCWKPQRKTSSSTCGKFSTLVIEFAKENGVIPIRGFACLFRFWNMNSHGLVIADERPSPKRFSSWPDETRPPHISSSLIGNRPGDHSSPSRFVPRDRTNCLKSNRISRTKGEKTVYNDFMLGRGRQLIPLFRSPIINRFL